MVPPRFIPTYMGNAGIRVCRSDAVSVHPHVHGERTPYRRMFATGCGSSPRTWGTPKNPSPLKEFLRFIPTYMGNAGIFGYQSIQTSVHPHVHGERYQSYLSEDKNAGSSPRTWGTLSTSFQKCVYTRFIPTYMGNAFITSSPVLAVSVHPHVHGERSSFFIPERWNFTSTYSNTGSEGRCEVSGNR